MKALLFADLKRQYEYAGSDRRVTWLAIAAHALHPRFLPLILIRFSRLCFLKRIPVVPGLCMYCNLVLFGLEISPRCEIGPGLFIPHTSGTTVGAVKIGSNVTIIGSVSIGAKELDMHWDPKLRPVIGDNVTFGAGCRVFGGVSVGSNVTIFPNSVVLRSIPSDSFAGGIPAKVVPRFSLKSKKAPGSTP